jgi:hypothetical protein
MPAHSWIKHFRPFIKCLSLILTLLMAGCKEEFSPPATNNSLNYLVVDGFINTGNVATNFHLSRTVNIKDTVTYRPESGASISIEGDNGFVTALSESDVGNYKGGPYNFNFDAHYRLHILTVGGSEYYSDYTTAYMAPPIDSIGWQRNRDGVLIYLNSHDQPGNTRYYHWSNEQTWKFHAAYASSLQYENGFLVPRLNYDSIYTCWHSEKSKDLLIGSSAALSENIIYKQPIAFIPENSWQISDKYSILVKQEAIDKGTFDYMQLVKKSTEQTGTIFDPQPSSINGNIHCTNDNKQIALGYIYASSVTEKRIFIDKSEVPGWIYNSGCYTFYSETPSDISFVAAGYYIPIAMNNTGLLLTTDFCGNCTLRGTHQKPDFWP